MPNNRLSSVVCAVFCLALPLHGAHAASLLQVYLDAVQNDPEIKSEHALYLAEVDHGDKTAGRLYPSVVLTGEMARKREDVVVGAGATGTSGVTYFDNNRLELTVKQALYRKDIFTAVDIDEARARVAESEYQSAYQSFILRVVNRYMAVLAAANDLGYQQAEGKAIDKQLSDARRRFNAGVGTKTDLYEAQASYDLSRAKVIVAETALNDAMAALNEVTNLDYESLSDLPDNFLPVFDGSTGVDSWLQAADRANQNLEASRQRIAVARFEVEKASSGHYPELDIVARYRTEETGGRFGESDTDDKSIALQLSFPLYEGGQVNATVRESNNRLNAEKEKYNKVYRNVRRSVINTFRSINSSINQVKALRKATESAESALNAIRSGFDAGTRTTTDILNAQKELFRARRDHMQMQYQFIISYLELKSMSGDLTEADVELVDSWLTD